MLEFFDFLKEQLSVICLCQLFSCGIEMFVVVHVYLNIPLGPSLTSSPDEVSGDKFSLYCNYVLSVLYTRAVILPLVHCQMAGPKHTFSSQSAITHRDDHFI